MSDKGYVYVLINPSLKGIVKIGKTTRTPEERAKELSLATGVPTPFIVAYECCFNNCSEAETFVHDFLEDKGYRVSRNREFFELPIKDAIDAIIMASNTLEQCTSEKNINSEQDEEDSEPWNDFVGQAECYEYGWDDCIKDNEEAIKYYSKAILLGYVEGYEKVAQLYEDTEQFILAYKYYEDGIKKGCTNCYSGLGMYYLYHELDFNKAFKNFYLYVKENDMDDLFPLYICYYLVLSIKRIEIDEIEKDIKYFKKILPYKEEILKYFSKNLFQFNFFHNDVTFYDLPRKSQEDGIQAYAEHGRDDYRFARFNVTYEITDDFLQYIIHIFSDSYISPNDFDGSVFELTIMEI
ncbi:MAG: GIY-YIG nuclease family protein [Bacteroidales bacterium]|nr:GIY-YIG nuclease family protein [Bacteroidales bacterium]